MKLDGHRWSGRRAERSIRLTTEQHAALFERALEWRQEWRAEMAARNAADHEGPAAPPTQPGTTRPGKDRATFAAGMARAELKQFYWDARKHLVCEARRRSRPPMNGKGGR